VRTLVPQMSQVLLLVFDECHHAKAKHPYSRIMQLFYHSHVGGAGAEAPRAVVGWGMCVQGRAASLAAAPLVN
jgi:endoribonuclease Dicer